MSGFCTSPVELHEKTPVMNKIGHQIIFGILFRKRLPLYVVLRPLPPQKKGVKYTLPPVSL